MLKKKKKKLRWVSEDINVFVELDFQFCVICVVQSKILSKINSQIALNNY